jgi:hypothetical protein
MTDAFEIAIRLADEGVPLGAIARSVQLPSEELRRHLCLVRDAGRLISLPRADWPPGFPREERAVELSRQIVSDREALAMAAKQMFDLTPIEADLFLLLLQPGTIRHDVATSIRTTYVHIHNLRRRLTAFGLTIANIWGYGYKLSDPDRRRAMDLIMGREAA